jgi:hypothetical protein
MTHGENIFPEYLFVQAKASTLCHDARQQTDVACLQCLAATMRRINARLQRAVACAHQPDASLNASMYVCNDSLHQCNSSMRVCNDLL